MLLAHRGFDVTVLEKADRVGGRNAELRVGDFVFDTGPTFLMMKFVLDEMFQETGRDGSEYMEFVFLDPMYRLLLDDRSLLFAEDYHRNVEQIFELHELSEDMSFYIRNASVTDPTLAPEGKSALYVLVPVPNNKSGIDWDREEHPYREKILDTIADRTAMKDLREHIEVEKVITPTQWESDYNVYLGVPSTWRTTWGRCFT